MSRLAAVVAAGDASVPALPLPPSRVECRYAHVVCHTPGARMVASIAAFTALAVGNVGKQQDAATEGHAAAWHSAEDCCGTHAKHRFHDTSRIAWAQLMTRVGEGFSPPVPKLWRRHPPHRLHRGAMARSTAMVHVFRFHRARARASASSAGISVVISASQQPVQPSPISLVASPHQVS